MTKFSQIVERANRFCAQHGERLTKPRIETLKVIAASTQSIRAYEILDKLHSVMQSPKPPTVYRAIDFWVRHGFIHRIESLNAYVMCHDHDTHKGSQFMICDQCGSANEIPVSAFSTCLKKYVKDGAFTPSDWSIEIHGVCAHCQTA